MTTTNLELKETNSNCVIDTLFFKGGTIDFNDIIYLPQIKHHKNPKQYKLGFAFNNNYMFIFKGKELVKVVKNDSQSGLDGFIYCVLKTKVKMNIKEFIRMSKDEFWQYQVVTTLLGIIEKTRSVN